MDLRPNEQQSMLRDSARRFLGEAYDFDARRKDIADNSSPGMWKAVTDLGWPGAALPEDAGGLGGSVVEYAILMEEMGRSLYVGPFLSTAICAAVLRSAEGPRASELVAQIASHGAKAALAHGEPGGRGFFDRPAAVARRDGDVYRISGRKRLVHDLAAADFALVTAAIADGAGLFLVSTDTSGLARRDYRTIDNGQASDLELDGTPAELIVGGEAARHALDDGFCWLSIGLGAEAVGIAEGALSHTSDYVGVRKQFGRTLSDFQVIQHRLADMFVEIEQLKSSLLGAMSAHEGSPLERMRAALGLKTLAGQVAAKVSGDGLHLHGGMGMTDEMPISHFYRRARVLEAQYGNSDYFLAAYARLLD